MADVKPADAGSAEPEKQAAADVDASAKEAAAKVKADKAAAKPAAAPAKPEADKAEPKNGYVVTGAAVVLPTEGGSERYLYRGAPIGEGFTKDGIKHALSVGLIAKAK